MRLTFIKSKVFHLDMKDKKILRSMVSFCVRSSKYASAKTFKKAVGFTYDDASYFYNIFSK